ncbi:DNA packaging protein [Rummeliibacillus sp. TYF-LIM-RU47]|uniref:DNA packaging protein n=1 Tax=Rummeliibacillus sp. TYF-LIM-RU47 TaxID=2608406 RepID=UPI00123C6F13|nr:DNA packaging protein [Rummeliibacillus sp. TYF-LIM-RU47]
MPTLTKKQKLEKITKDFKLFSKNFIKIINNDNESVPFVLNPEQSQFIDDMGKYNIIAKGRQIGFTTLSLGYMIFSALTKPDTSYLMMTHNGKVTQSLLRKLKKMYNSLPHDKYPELFPKTTIDNRDEMSFVNGSRIVVATAEGTDSISGNTFQLIHLSEMAKYPVNVQEEIIATAIPALAKNPDSAIIIESTAMGFNYYQELFMEAYRTNDSVWKPFFYSWLAEAYTKQFKHSFDEAEEWWKVNNKGKRMSYDDLEQDEIELKEKYNCSFRQLMYRRYYITLNSLEKWNREFPITPEVAFSTSNKSVFDTDKILTRFNNAKKPIHIKEAREKLPESLHKYLNKSLFIYNFPKSKMRHFGGVDVASGVGQDNSTISIFNAEGEQCACFYSNKVPVYEFAQVVNDLGRYFNYAFLCVERNSYGLPLLERLRKEYGYENLLKQKVFNERGKKIRQLGFMTTNVTKPIIVNDMKEHFECNMILIHSLETLDEMKIFQENNGKTGNKKGKGNHDDLVIAVSMAIQAMKLNKYYVAI